MEFDYLVGSPSTFLSLVKDFKQKNKPYEMIEIEFNNFNSFWKGRKGLALKVSREVYYSLHTISHENN